MNALSTSTNWQACSVFLAILLTDMRAKELSPHCALAGRGDFPRNRFEKKWQSQEIYGLTRQGQKFLLKNPDKTSALSPLSTVDTQLNIERSGVSPKNLAPHPKT